MLVLLEHRYAQFVVIVVTGHCLEFACLLDLSHRVLLLEVEFLKEDGSGFGLLSLYEIGDLEGIILGVGYILKIALHAYIFQDAWKTLFTIGSVLKPFYLFVSTTCLWETKNEIRITAM